MSKGGQSPGGLVKIYVSVNGDRAEVIEFSRNCTHEEVVNVLRAAADFPPLFDGSNGKASGLPEPLKVIMILKNAQGDIVPIGPDIPPNSSEPADRYKLNAIDGNLASSDFEQSLQEVIEATAGVNLDEVMDLKKNLDLLRKKLDDYEKLQILPGAVAPRIFKRPAKGSSRFATRSKYVLTDETKNELKHPSFDMWDWDENEMIGLMEHMFTDLGLIDDFNIDRPTLRRFIGAIRESYNHNPFHNFRHCFSVTQMAYAIIQTTGTVHKLKPIDRLIIMLSTVGHGYNNAYQINALTDVAILYNDQSPLEMHHAAVLFTILQDDQFNILKHLSDTVYREVRKNVIRSWDIIAGFKSITETFNYEDPEHKSLVDQAYISRTNIYTEPWVECLLTEFFSQSDREKAEGLPTAPFMDREKVTKAGAQVGFIGYVMIPLFELASKVMPNMEEAILSPVHQSLAFYKDMLEKTTAKA
ncbi:hypothetical protein BC829DRAFT_395376 [Chytridium lagenaria]|nr:hypothetical protein BC829DRAFT_395376 [Chytridium lagenaria]